MWALWRDVTSEIRLLVCFLALHLMWKFSSGMFVPSCFRRCALSPYICLCLLISNKVTHLGVLFREAPQRNALKLLSSTCIHCEWSSVGIRYKLKVYFKWLMLFKLLETILPPLIFILYGLSNRRCNQTWAIATLKWWCACEGVKQSLIHMELFLIVAFNVTRCLSMCLNVSARVVLLRSLIHLKPVKLGMCLSTLLN